MCIAALGLAVGDAQSAKDGSSDYVLSAGLAYLECASADIMVRDLLASADVDAVEDAIGESGHTHMILVRPG
jgi:hypothetical protein